MARLPRNLLVLGLVSFLTDASTEMVFPLLPLFVASVGGTALAVGLMEGTAETVASFLKYASGRLSDQWRRRKHLLVAGYGFSALMKFGYPVATQAAHIVALRSLDRVGKGIRGPPRDALIADSMPAKHWGLGFGFHRAMDTLGALAGPLVGLALVAVWSFSVRHVFLVAALPALFGALLLVSVHDVRPATRRRVRVPFPHDAAIYGYLLTVAVFTLGNLALVFYLLLAAERGLAVTDILLLYALYTAVYATLAVPFGSLTDRIGRAPVVAASFALLIAASLSVVGADPRTLAAFVPPMVLFGVASAAFEGNGRALAADLAPRRARASVLGAYHAAIGFAALPAGLLMGLAWDRIHPLAVFLLGALFAWAALLELLWMWGHGQLRPRPDRA